MLVSFEQDVLDSRANTLIPVAFLHAYIHMARNLECEKKNSQRSGH